MGQWDSSIGHVCTVAQWHSGTVGWGTLHAGKAGAPQPSLELPNTPDPDLTGFGSCARLPRSVDDSGREMSIHAVVTVIEIRRRPKEEPGHRSG